MTEKSDWLVGEKEPQRETRWLDLAVFLGLVFGVALLSQGCQKGCPPGPPTPGPTVTPTTPPAVNYHPELLLTTRGGDFVYPDGTVCELRKDVACCEGTQGTGWPGCSEAFVNFAYNQGRANMLHWRVGPFSSKNEPEWPAGGGYVEAADGRVDLSAWNESYWAAFAARIQQANDLGIVLEVSLVDGWGVKTVKWASGPGPAAWHPWHSAGNVQGEDHLSRAWRGPLDAVHAAWIRKAVEESCPWGGIVYEGGTEADQVPGASIAWEVATLALVRQVEAERGCAAHLYGSNFVADPVFPLLKANRVQYLNVHQTQPADAATFWGSDPIRPYVNDEYNPEPAMKPEAVAAFWQYARAHGTHWAAWRHSQAENPWKASLSLIAQGGRPGWEDGCPYDVAPVASISCKRHSGNLMDCTPKSSTGQPIRPEGDITRSLCERAALKMGPADRISYSLVNTSGSIGINTRPNVFQFVLTGTPGASGTLRCSAPSAPTVDLCRGPVVSVQ